MYKKILLAYDGSQSGQKALLDCQDLAQWSHAELSLVAVLPINIGLVSTEGGVHLFDETVTCGIEFREVPLHPDDCLEAPEQRRRGRGILRGGDVVGNVGPEAGAGEARSTDGIVEDADDAGRSFVAGRLQVKPA